MTLFDPGQREVYQQQVQQARRGVARHFAILITIIALLWLIEAVDQLFWRGQLDFFGVEPRTLTGLRNIIFAPFLHKGFNHLLANTLPFLVLGWFVMLSGIREFVAVSLIAMLVSGGGVWVLGMPHTVHVGLSGVIFGYLGFLLLRGYLERSTTAIVLALLAGLLYGSMIWGILPLQPNVSWLGHLFGLIGGGLAARWLTVR